MFSDGFRHSHPIETPIRKASEIDEIFDDITYEKGASVIRFLHAYIGDAAFRLGLTNYLAEYAYKNTITENLWSHLSRASHRDHLSEILSTWTKQMGYPLLIVRKQKLIEIVFFQKKRRTLVFRFNKNNEVTIDF